MKATRIQLATGLTYNVQEWSGSHDRTFVLVHGFTDLGAGWSEVAIYLAAHGHVIAPDLRGHGDSDWIGPGGYYHFMDYVADLDDVVRQLARTDKIVLVGHSMGGSVCGYYAGIHPEKLSSLVLVEGLGPPDMMGGEGPLRTAAWVDAWRTARAKQPKVMASIEEAVARLKKHDTMLDDALAKKLATIGTRPVDGGGFAWKHDPLHGTFGPYAYRLETARKYWERITCPVLAIDGAESKMNLSAEERASRRTSFKSIRHLVIEGAGHAVQRHKPHELATAILSVTDRSG
jgi:pimeloyl-ACP methyl ester carboxylesterase